MSEFASLPLFSLAKDWIPSLVHKLSEIRSRRDSEMDALADILRGDPVELASNYIQPDCQQFNPADSAYEDDIGVVRQPVFDRLEQFCGSGPAKINQMMVLADAGMGKTSLLVMFRLGYLNSFWPKHYQCLLLKSGLDTLPMIANTIDRRKTILLIDALDEDPIGWGRSTPRLHELLSATTGFYRVIITCRTQFFSGGEDPFERRGFVGTGGYLVPVVYLSSFLPSQVNKYLTRRFPHQPVELDRAEQMVAKMQSLRFRPMLLAHIEDLLVSAKHDWTEFSVYTALVNAWLMREERKARERTDSRPPTAKSLLDVCHKIAWRLHIDGVSSVSEETLTRWIMTDPSLRLVEGLDIRGRSLLNRTSTGDFRFSHSSIQEFLVVQALLQTQLAQPGTLDNVRITGLMLTFVLGALNEGNRDASVLRLLKLTNLDLSRANMSGINLSGLNLAGSRLEETDLSSAVLKNAVLNGCQATRSLLREADCEGLAANDADFGNADMSSCSVDQASLVRASMQGVLADKASFNRARLEAATLSGATLTNASLQDVDARLLKAQKMTATFSDFTGAVLVQADLRESHLEDSVFRKCDLQRADMGRVHARGADLSAADCREADMRFMNANHVNLNEANLSKAKASNAIFTEANMCNLQATKASFDFSNLESVDMQGALLDDASLEAINGLNLNGRGVKADRANFTFANLRKSVFAGASLQGAIMIGADLRDVDFSGADLSDADLTRAKTDGANWNGARLRGVKRG